MSKRFINHYLRGIALFSLLMMAGASLAASRPAAAADCNGISDAQCGLVTVHVYDTETGTPVVDAKVALVDAFGNVTYAYSPMAGPGVYVASVTVGDYKVLVSAQGYLPYSTDTRASPVKTTIVKAPLLANSLRAPSAPALGATAPANT